MLAQLRRSKVALPAMHTSYFRLPFEPLFEPFRSLASCGNRASRLRSRTERKIPRAIQVGFSVETASAAFVKSFNPNRESWRAPLS